MCTKIEETNKMKRILLLTDLTQASMHGINYGIQLYGENPGSESIQFVLFHAHYSETMLSPYSGPLASIDDAKGLETANLKLDSQLEKVKNEYPDINIEKLFVQGPLTWCLKDHFAEYPFDLIVLSSKEKNKISRFVLGSNALDLLSSSPSPLMIVPSSLGHKKPEKILLATDFNNLEDLKILEPLTNLQQISGGEMMMLNVYNSKKADPHELAIQEDRLERYFEDAPFRYFFLDHKDPLKAIDEFITGYSADVLVLVSQERKLLERIFHKSVSKPLVVHSGIPILILKSYKVDEKNTEAEPLTQHGQVKKWRTQIDAMKVQMNLGKRELADEMVETQVRAGKQWQQVKDKLDGFSDMSSERWDHFKQEISESIRHLAQAFGMRKSN